MIRIPNTAKYTSRIYLNPLVLEAPMPRESRLTRGGIRTLVADEEAAGVLNTHMTLERPAVRRHKVAQGAGLLHTVLNPHVLVQPRLCPEGQVAVLAPVLAHVAPDVVPAQLIRRAALEVAAVAAVGDVRVLGLLVAGLERTQVFFFNPAQWVFWVIWFFFGFFGFFGFFYIFAQKREFLGFFQFQEYFKVHPEFKL